MEIIIKLCIITYSYLFNKLFALVFFWKHFKIFSIHTGFHKWNHQRFHVGGNSLSTVLQASTVEWPSFGSMQFRGSHALLKVPVIKMDLLNPIS